MKSIFLLLVVTATSTLASDYDSASVNSMRPPLDAVLATAVKHRPLLRREAASTEMYRQELNMAKKDWLRGLTLEVSSQYGSYGDQTANKLYLGNRVGASARFSLEDVFSRGNKLEKYEAAVTVSEFNRQNLENDLRQIITSIYAKTMTHIQLMMVATQALNNANVQRQNADEKFRAGELPLLDYSRIIDISNQASLTLERSRGDMREGWMMLEQIVGAPLASLRESQ